MRARSLFCLVLGLLMLMRPAVCSAGYPDRPVRLIVPFPPGGGTDALARLVGDHLGRALRQAVVIDNRGGAGGNIAMQAAATAAPDGYTLFFATTGTMTINPAIYKNRMHVNPLADFEPIGTAVKAPHAVIINKDLPVATIGELIALARSEPGRLTFGSSGNGGTVHLTGELFKTSAQIDILHIPYRGSAPAIMDLLSGQISMIFDLISGDLPYIASGKVRILAVTAENRIPALPDVPTVSESGLPGFASTSWFGIVVPRGTPAEVRTLLSSALEAALADEGLKGRLVSLGAEVFPGTPDDFAALLRTDTVKWAALVAQSGAGIE